jgi:hypothetical protein
MLNFRTRRAKPVIKKSSQRDKGSITHILQGIFVLVLGLVFIIANANPGIQYKEISGRIQDLYEHTINGQYNSNWLSIYSDPQDIFIFDKNALHPAWNYQFFKGEQIDIYYVDEIPKTVVALQFYDQLGDQLTKYTTSDYQPNQQSTPLTNIGFDIGVVLSIIGLLMIGFALYHAINNRRRKHPEMDAFS